jgi:hypothetical protein
MQRFGLDQPRIEAQQAALPAGHQRVDLKRLEQCSAVHRTTTMKAQGQFVIRPLTRSTNVVPRSLSSAPAWAAYVH